MQQRTFDIFPKTKLQFRQKQCEIKCFTQDVAMKTPFGHNML